MHSLYTFPCGNQGQAVVNKMFDIYKHFVYVIKWLLKMFGDEVNKMMLK